ncbi:MAG: glycosyltransferase family 2 protein [Sandaracinaceae bacterium]
MLFSPLGLLASATTLPGTLELTALTVGSLLPPRRIPRSDRRIGALGVVVPAHDEEAGIARCVESLLACRFPPGGARILVVADNCSDRTAHRAADAGAEVLVRNDVERRGKGYALELAFDHLLSDPDVEAVLVVDADTRVDPSFLVEMANAFAAGADGAQCKYLVSNPRATPGASLMNVALMAFNVARPRARERFGLSVGILGNGFGLHRRVLERLPYTARSVVEDLEYHLMMVREGFAVRFVDTTAVWADVPTSSEGQRTQRERWEGGRLRMIREHAPPLLAELVAGRMELAEPLGELLLLPLATHVGLLGVTALIPFAPTQLYALASLGVVGAHVLAAMRAAGAGPEDYRALARAPGYVLQKVGRLPGIVTASRREHSWVRTAREPSSA